MLAYLIDEQAMVCEEAGREVALVVPAPDDDQGCGRTWPTRPRSSSKADAGFPPAGAAQTRAAASPPTRRRRPLGSRPAERRGALTPRPGRTACPTQRHHGRPLVAGDSRGTGPPAP
jgi:hypothetical protein